MAIIKYNELLVQNLFIFYVLLYHLPYFISFSYIAAALDMSTIFHNIIVHYPTVGNINTYYYNLVNMMVISDQ